MKLFILLFLAGAQLAASESICVKYTKALFVNDTAVNELALITAVVDIAVNGDEDLDVPGIYSAEGGLVRFFNGAGATTNRGDTAVTVNFLDKGSNQKALNDHLYQFFGGLLGCSAAGFPAYEGDADMWRVHKFMAITEEQNDYFISQVGLAATVLGVSVEDATVIGNVLDGIFNTRCPQLLTESDGVPAFLVGTNPSICQVESCPLAVNSTCGNDNVYETPSPSPLEQAPPTDDATICVKYTKALFVNDTADNEFALIMAVVDLAVLGDPELNVSGILAPNQGLTRFFSGAGPTTNRGDTAVSINFLDGATNQQTLLVHLYQFFGALLGCSAPDFPIYEGDADMYRVHKFMEITEELNDYFILQVGLAALGLGVTADDVATIGLVLDGLFNTRCPPILSTSDGVPEFLVGTNPSICSADSCPLAVNGTCDAADPSPSPQTETPPPSPVDDSICVKYTKALFVNDTADNEYALIMAVVDLAVLGDLELNVSGILATEGGLAPFFNGTASTTNRGDMAVSVNFLDGATNQQTLLVHLYQFFGALLGCSAPDFPIYEGDADMYRVHKFMLINEKQNDFFINQVGLAALGLGVTADDVAMIGLVLDGFFNTRCPPILSTSDGVPEFLVGTNPSICSADSCPLAVNATCNDNDSPIQSPVMAPVRPPSAAGGETGSSAASSFLFFTYLATGIALCGLIDIGLM